MINLFKKPDFDSLSEQWEIETSKANDYIVAGKHIEGLDYLLKSVKTSKKLNDNYGDIYHGHDDFMGHVMQTQMMFTEDPDAYTHKIWYELNKYTN